MAVLAPQDWHPPRDLSMDAPSPNSINPSVPRQRSSPANDHSLAQSPMSQQQPYPYPVQQQQAAWSPSPQQFYPSFYQNPHQQPYPMHGHPPHPQQGQMPYYDPANAQLAQWAYQQMMFNAQQAHQMSQMNGMGSQRGRNGGNPNPEYFAQSPMSGFSPFPSGTPPPPHPSQLPMGYSPAPSEQGSQYGGYHPYRRPQRQGSSNHDSDWRSGSQQQQHSGPFKPPYAHADAAGSSTSVNSGSSQSGSQRQRTNSNQGSSAGGSNSASSPVHSHPKQASTRSNSSGSTPPPTNGAVAPPRVHQRTGSSSSNASARLAAPSATTSTSSNAAPHNLRKPSPLSQGTYTAAEKRMSRDDSDLAAMLEPSGGPRGSGLKGRLRRALALNANATLHEVDEDATARHDIPRPSQSSASSNATLAMDDGDSTATVQKKKSRSLFNNKFNRSTDNISLSSTMSSASMVIRKLGSIGKLARRNSLAGITSLFKDKKDKDGEEEGGGGSGKKSKKKKGEKAAAAEASVSHVTAELDRSEWSSNPEMAGLSPAARLARQHTLKSNAEAAARAKAEAEARVAAQAQAVNVPTTWEKNTTSRQGEGSPAKIGSSSKVNENGMRVVVEHDDSDSGSEGGHDNHAPNYSIEGWEDDEDWGEAHEEEDITIRQALDSASLEEDEDMEPWAINVRRSVERTRKPAKGILKNGSDYSQDAYLPPNPAFTRARSNSYDSAPLQGEVPPLGHLPQSDPAQIDGLQHKSHGSTNGHSPQTSATFLPPLSFDSKLTLDSPSKTETPTAITSSLGPEKEKASLFSHPNSSAPALSTMFPVSNPPTLSHRSATAPAKRLAFAANLSVYDTFPATVYDRRSEPATWSRLTPALAQRIKEELNSYKMEEMEVHAASRVHTQFFV
ncbi:hypothetical protein GSI_06930 [Ganoderma sinense ZZ0214-1]|uniref:Uncharacterized protein n=1 Tax=Ganoderma sinense ZZ0214-1 TaxID=1077348 RepID=A0A2G8SAI0_9APHY|nr:hypothetical protein GSI_06930 [Ganoderma sinense ZZ0214-1]